MLASRNKKTFSLRDVVEMIRFSGIIAVRYGRSKCLRVLQPGRSSEAIWWVTKQRLQVFLSKKCHCCSINIHTATSSVHLTVQIKISKPSSKNSDYNKSWLSSERERERERENERERELRTNHDGYFLDCLKKESKI